MPEKPTAAEWRDLALRARVYLDECRSPGADAVMLAIDEARARDEVRKPRLVCAWCGKELRPEPEPFSHGICEACTRVMGEDVDLVYAEARRER